jgi:hypothetical protein
VGGLDESHARAVLLEMQERLVGGPHAALGLAPSATPPEIRSAFLELTKTYHPARFGYLSADLQRLSNEVFLALRAAHDAIARPVRAGRDRSAPVPVPVSPRADRSGAMPAVGRGAGAGPSGPPVGGGARPAERTGERPPDRGADKERSGAAPAQSVPRPPSPPVGAAAALSARDRSGVSPAIAVPRPPALGVGSPVAPASAPGARDRSGVSPAIAVPRPPTLAGGSGVGPALAGPGAARSTSSPGGAPPAAGASGPARAGGPRAVSPAPRPPAATPPAPGPAPRASGAAGASADRVLELASVLDQIQRGQWEAARAALAALAAKAPEVARYRALLAYTRGREAQLAQRLDEARVELQDALQLDPDLQLAKTALAELFTRRK